MNNEITYKQKIEGQIEAGREALKQAKADRIKFAEAENEFKRCRARALVAVALAEASIKGKPVPSTNADTRRAYVEHETVEAEARRNLAKEEMDSSVDAFEYERTVLSALKTLSAEETFERFSGD